MHRTSVFYSWIKQCGMRVGRLVAALSAACRTERVARYLYSQHQYARPTPPRGGHANQRSPQIWTPFLSTGVSERAQRTRVSRCSWSSFADLARVKSSKRGPDLGASLTNVSLGTVEGKHPSQSHSTTAESSRSIQRERQEGSSPSAQCRVRNLCFKV